MDGRQEEIKFVLDLIQEICKEANICLISQEGNGIKYVGIHDNIENKDYILAKK